MRQWFRRLAESGPVNLPEILLLSFLTPFGWCYDLLGRLRARLYRAGVFSSYRAPVPVISVGNLTLGGTGKTPTADYLLRYLISRGLRAAVVSRGYGGTAGKGIGIVAPGNGSAPRMHASECGDEPLLLAERNPQAIVLVASRRRDGVQLAVDRFGAQVVLLDDGFQHLAVARDLDLVLLDAARPFGNGRVFPAGLLRETPAALQRADLLLHSRARDEVPEVLQGPNRPCGKSFSRFADLLRGLDGRVHLWDALSGLKGLAFAGIASPGSFFKALEEREVQLAATIPLRDHAQYDEDLYQRLNSAATGADFFVTTEKDGVKLRADKLALPCYVVSLELAFDPPLFLEQHVDVLLQRWNLP